MSTARARVIAMKDAKLRLPRVAVKPAETEATEVEAPSAAIEPVQKAAVEILPEAVDPTKILHNAHDVAKLQEEGIAILRELSARGVGIRMDSVMASAQSHAAIRLLILKGICTEAEAQGEVLTTVRDYLRSILQQVEQQQLQGQSSATQQPTGPKVEVVKTPGLLVAKR